jgi:hypothetical protein
LYSTGLKYPSVPLHFKNPEIHCMQGFQGFSILLMIHKIMYYFGSDVFLDRFFQNLTFMLLSFGKRRNTSCLHPLIFSYSSKAFEYRLSFEKTRFDCRQNPINLTKFLRTASFNFSAGIVNVSAGPCFLFCNVIT